VTGKGGEEEETSGGEERARERSFFASDSGLGYNEIQRKTSNPLAMPGGIG
jgi:hypothetical protein